jgi:hypothetical protein
MATAPTQWATIDDLYKFEAKAELIGGKIEVNTIFDRKR